MEIAILCFETLTVSELLVVVYTLGKRLRRENVRHCTTLFPFQMNKQNSKEQEKLSGSKRILCNREYAFQNTSFFILLQFRNKDYFTLGILIDLTTAFETVDQNIEL